MVDSPADANEDDTWYELDGQDRIVDMGGGWRMPGFDRYVESLAGYTVLGTRIYDHVSGHFTRSFLKEFFEGARAAGVLVRRNYRCDAPEFKRLMEMKVERHGERGLIVSHRTLDERRAPFPIAFVKSSIRQVPTVLRCSMCNRLQRSRKAPVVWGEPEECLAPREAARAIYTVCPDCRSGLSPKVS